MMPEPAVDVLAAVEEAEALLRERKRSEASQQLRWVVEVSRDPALLRRVHELALEAAASTRDALTATVVWAPLVHAAAGKLEAAEAVERRAGRVVWQEDDEVVSGELVAGPDALVLGGRRRIRYRDVVRARLGRHDERVGGRATLVVESRTSSERVGVGDAQLLAALVQLLG